MADQVHQKPKSEPRPKRQKKTKKEKFKLPEFSFPVRHFFIREGDTPLIRGCIATGRPEEGKILYAVAVVNKLDYRCGSRMKGRKAAYERLKAYSDGGLEAKIGKDGEPNFSAAKVGAFIVKPEENAAIALTDFLAIDPDLPRKFRKNLAHHAVILRTRPRRVALKVFNAIQDQWDKLGFDMKQRLDLLGHFWPSDAVPVSDVVPVAEVRPAWSRSSGE